MAKTEVAEKKAGAVGIYDYGEMAGEGFENSSANELSIPFIYVLQSNSPQVEEQTIEGAAAGMLLNSVTGELLTQPLVVLPCYKEEVWVEWRPRNKGGGIVDRHDPGAEEVLNVIRQNNNSRIPPKDAEGKRVPFKLNDNELVETYYVYVLLLEENGWDVAGWGVLSFSSTKIKKWKDWHTSMIQIKGPPPLFANRAKIATVKERNDVGQSYYNFNITPFSSRWIDSLVPPNEEGIKLMEEAKKFRKMVLDGIARPDYTGAEQAQEGASPGTADDEMPF